MYFESIKNNNITYSIDMLRLTTRITYSDFSKLEFFFNNVFTDNIVIKQYTSSKFSDFMFNFVIECEEGSFWFGFLHNSEKRNFADDYLYNFTIEFNPNKLKYNKFVVKILHSFSDWRLRSFDLAMDLPVNILDIIGFQRGRRKDIKTISMGFDNKTVYIGKTDNRVKIYNKKIESNLDINGELTRIEISKQLENYDISRIQFYNFDDVFPELFLNNYLYTFKDYENKTLLAVLYAVQNDFPLDNLTRSYKSKIKNLLYTAGCQIKFDTKTAGDVLRKVIYAYFVQPTSKQRFI